MVLEEDPWYTLVPPCFQLWSAAPNRTTSPYYDHTEKKTYAVWSSGQNGWVSRRQENSDCSSPVPSWMATLKNDLVRHNLILEDAIELALNKPLWRLLAASGATHWWCMLNNDEWCLKHITNFWSRSFSYSPCHPWHTKFYQNWIIFFTEILWYNYFQDGICLWCWNLEI